MFRSKMGIFSIRSIVLLLILIFPSGCIPPDNPQPASSASNSLTNMPFDLQGHRGARGLVPENTIPAFIYALDQGVTTLEMDVVISQDSQVVVSHEPWLSSQICSKEDNTPVSEEEEKELNMFQMTYDAISTFDCGSRGNPRFPNQVPMKISKPTLAQVIQEAENYVQNNEIPPVRYNIETKSSPEGDGIFHPAPDVFTKLVLSVISEFGIMDRTTLQSFDVRTLQVAKQEVPEMSLALLVGSHEQMNFDEWLDHLGFIPDIYSPYYQLVDSTLVENVHAREMQLIPWTINTLEEMQELKALGVDGIITDYPDIGRILLEE